MGVGDGRAASSGCPPEKPARWQGSCRCRDRARIKRPGQLTMRYHITTYGCQMNVADSRRLATELEKLGYLPAARA